jgi:hypothetical protein
MRLFEIVDSVQNALELSVDADGVISEEGLAALDELELTLESKVLNTALFLKGIEAERDAVARAAKELADRASIHTRQADRLREYLRSNMERAGHEGLSDPRVKIGWRSSTAVELDDDAVDRLPFEYIQVKRVPDKKAIREALEKFEAGDATQEVKGARLVQRRHLQVK